MRIRSLLAVLLVLAPLIRVASAEVLRVDVEHRELVLDGRSFGEAGAYEKLSGRMLFGWDPENPFNQRIVDLDKAVANDDGLVQAWADFMVLQPADAEKRRGVAFVEVSNRGGKASLSYFNRARSAFDPSSEAEFGDGLLMRQGLTLIWVGWQWDVPEEEGRFRLEAPVTRVSAGLEGLVRADWVVSEPTTTLALGHRRHRAYAPAAPDDERNVLTVRTGRTEGRQVVRREAWRFERDEAGRHVVAMDEGFAPGAIYELVYVARNPRVVGAGLAAIRDVIAHAKHDEACAFPVEHGIAFGVSQTGRFLRMFLYQGFNTDEWGRQAYDGMLIHTAGAGRGSFNHRFAQPSRDAHRFSAFFYPTDLFPFTSRVVEDPLTGARDGLMAHLHDETHTPKVFFTNTGYEYWGRAGALIHTTPDGAADVEPLPTERIYHLASGQHFVSRRPSAQRQGPGRLGNPLDFLVLERALLVRLVEWVAEGRNPPASRYPRIGEGTLVELSQWRFPPIDDLQVPAVAHEAYRVSYGPRWDEGVIDRQPPSIGPAFPVLVPRVDPAGNELGGVRAVEAQVPLASYTPWSLRTGLPGPQHELRDFVGLMIPLARTEAERAESGDARPSIESLYASESAYGIEVERAIDRLVGEGFMLEEDRERVRERALALWRELHAGG